MNLIEAFELNKTQRVVDPDGKVWECGSIRRSGAWSDKFIWGPWEVWVPPPVESWACVHVDGDIVLWPSEAAAEGNKRLVYGAARVVKMREVRETKGPNVFDALVAMVDAFDVGQRAASDSAIGKARKALGKPQVTL